MIFIVTTIRASLQFCQLFWLTAEFVSQGESEIELFISSRYVIRHKILPVPVAASVGFFLSFFQKGILIHTKQELIFKVLSSVEESQQSPLSICTQTLKASSKKNENNVLLVPQNSRFIHTLEFRVLFDVADFGIKFRVMDLEGEM